MRATLACWRLRAASRRSVRSLAVRRLVSMLGAIVALVTALSFPIGYGIIGYYKEGEALTYMAELTAARAAQYIYAPDAPWRYDTDQLAAISEIRTPTADPIVQRLLNLAGEKMMQKGEALAWPTFARAAPIIASGARFGMAEVSASLCPLLKEVALVGLGSLLLAVAAYFAFAVLPLGVLDRTLGELKATNAKFRRQNLLLDTALESMVHGLAMFDAEERIVIANDRYCQLYGIDPALVKAGTTLREVVEQRIAGGLYASASLEDALAAMRSRVAAKQTSQITNRLSDGRIIAATVQPRADGGWVVTHQDITERESLNAQLVQQNELLKRREEELEAQNVLLDAALENMFQGLAMFDAEERIVIANDRFAEMYGHQDVEPGTTLREILQHRVETGLYTGMTAEIALRTMRERLARKTVSHLTSKLGDGRTIVVSIRPLSHGGWVTTHQDITERENLHTQVERQNELLKQREEELAAQNARFYSGINNMSQGVCLFDAEQRVVFANHGYAGLYGMTVEQVKPGTTLRQIFEARMANGVYTPADVHQVVRRGIEEFRLEASSIFRLSDGRFISVQRRPMADGGVVSTHEDVTERETLNARLAEQNVRFDAALGNMSHGLCMFDAEQRVVITNDRYAEIYGLTPDQVKPGTTLRQIVEHRIALGLYAGDNPQDYIAERQAAFNAAATTVHRLSDGRAISISRTRMRGGGWVTTHEDVTEREKLKERLEQQNERLDAAMNNISHGLAMFDSEQRLVVCNKVYGEMYGLTPEQVKPGTSVREILQYRLTSGCHTASDTGTFVDELLGKLGNIDSETHQLADGRIINVSYRATSTGGHVITHQDITEQRRSEAKIAHMALHDALTGLANRVLLNERLEQALARVKRGEMLAVHLLDLDHFKDVNDTLGHAAGDKLLKMVTERLGGLIRETDTIARMGGDEFAVLQVAIAQPVDATVLALRIIESVGKPYEIEGQQVVIGASVGIAIGPTDGLSPEQLIRNADLALYRAKGDGRATYRFFGPEMDAQMQARRAMECDLRKAMPAGEFELYYQPVVNLASGEISGVEALIRWHHPEKGMIAPGTFIPVAEEIGFINALGEWAIREACATAASWPDNLKVAVNLSPLQFKSPGLVGTVVAALTTSGLAAERLELEITETVLLQDSEATLSTLYELRALGVRIAIDDFGTGHSSLSYLQSFPFDKIKIDRSFVKDVAEGTGSLNIVRAVAALAAGLGMTTTAEGVETSEQYDTVKSEGCTEMQGYLFSKPLPVSEVEALFRARRTVGLAAGTEHAA